MHEPQGAPRRERREGGFDGSMKFCRLTCFSLVSGYPLAFSPDQRPLDLANKTQNQTTHVSDSPNPRLLSHLYALKATASLHEKDDTKWTCLAIVSRVPRTDGQDWLEKKRPWAVQPNLLLDVESQTTGLTCAEHHCPF